MVLECDQLLSTQLPNWIRLRLGQLRAEVSGLSPGRIASAQRPSSEASSALFIHTVTPNAMRGSVPDLPPGRWCGEPWPGTTAAEGPAYFSGLQNAQLPTTHPYADSTGHLQLAKQAVFLPLVACDTDPQVRGLYS